MKLAKATRPRRSEIFFSFEFRAISRGKGRMATR